MHQDEEFSLKNFFTPFTTLKAIHWLIIAGLATYFNGLFNGFVADDLPLIIFNPIIHSLSNIFSLFHESTYYTSSQDALSGIYYKPIMLSTFTLLYALFGQQAFFYHSLQLFLHIINGMLVFAFLRKFFPNYLSFFLSAIFLIHPLNAESVLYISAMQENLFFLFGMSSLLLLAYKKTSVIALFLPPVLVLLSLLSKETGILFLLIDIVYGVMFLKHDKIKKILFLSVSFLVYIIFRLSAMGFGIHNVKSNPIMILDFGQRLLNIPSLIDFYLVRFFFPKDLLMSYNEVIQKITFSNFYFHLSIIITGIIFICLIGAHLWRRHHENRLLYIFFVIWLVVGLGLHMQLIPLDQSAAERWFYFPMVGVLGMSGIVLQMLLKEKQKMKIAFFTLSIGTLLLLGIRTFIRTFDWKNGVTLYTHDLTVSKNDFLLHGNLGYELFQMGDIQQAKKELQISVALFPYSAINYSNYCLIQYLIGQNENNVKEKSNGIRCYQHMLTSFNYQPAIYEKLLEIFLEENDLPSAEKYIQKALQKYPKRALFWYYLAQIDVKKSNNREAKKAIQNAYTLDPTDPHILQLSQQLTQTKD